MAYIKKTWVNVPNPSNPPSIPDGQDALARFDAENMNRIEDGIEKSVAHVSDSVVHNQVRTGGGAIGIGAKTNPYGGSIGYNATSLNGGAVGSEANAENGGAVGNGARTAQGGALGYNTRTSDGAAIGANAKTLDVSGNPIDAIQLGAGTNNTPKTLKVYDYPLLNADGTIPDDRMPTKAPSGHGVGELALGYYTDFIDMIHKGGGFYVVGNATDSPTGKESWLNLIQLTKGYAEGGGTETGVQIVADSLPANSSKGEFWVRTLFEGVPTTWRKILHSENYTSFANTKIQTGSYVGTGVSGSGNPNTITANFDIKVAFIYREDTAAQLIALKGAAVAQGSTLTSSVSLAWSNNRFDWWANTSNSGAYYQFNDTGKTYKYILIG